MCISNSSCCLQNRIILLSFLTHLFSFIFSHSRIKSKFDLLNSHIHNSKVIQKNCQVSEEWWHPQHPKASSRPCPEPLQCSLGDAYPVALLTISVTEETAALTAAFASQHSPHMLYNAWQKTWFLADFVRGWHYERTIEEKSRHFRERVSENWGSCVRGQRHNSNRWQGIIQGQGNEVWGTQKQAANAGEL